MKKVFRIFILLLAAGLMLAVTACKPFEGFNDKDAILKTTTYRYPGGTESINLSKYELTAPKFNGVIRIIDIDIDVSGKIVFKMDLKINSGKFKVVLVKDDEVFMVTDKNVQESIKVEDLSVGTYNLRIVGSDANIEFVFYF